MKFSKNVCFFIIAILAIIYLWSWLENSESVHAYDFKYYVIKIENSTEGTHFKTTYSVTTCSSLSNRSDFFNNQSKCLDCIILAVVSCGEKFKETNNLIKSAIALSAKPLLIKIFTEESLVSKFISSSKSWPEDVQRRVTLNIHIANYPQGFSDKTWRSLFKKCASIRLFLPDLLPEVDSLIYADTDVLLLGPIENIWNHFHRMNSTQMAAMVQEHEDPATGWYNRFAKHPYYGKLGLNSGVMLMNLTRLRKFGWGEYLSPILREFHSAITWGDQDIINIIFHYHPDKLYLFGCEYNYRPDHCMYMSVCKTAEQNGIYALHGSRGVYYNEKQPAFKAVFNVFDQYHLGEDLRQNLYYPLQKHLLNYTNSNCGKISKLFLKNLSSLVKL